MIVDFHSHHFPPAVAARAIGALSKVVDGKLWPVGDGTLENHLDHMDLAGIDKAVMLPVATKPTQYKVILETALAIRDGALGERARRKIVPFAAVHPQDPDWAKHLDEIASHGIKGLKFHPYYQDFSLSDPAVWPIFRKVAELGLIVECHAGYDVGYPGRYDSCSPKDIVTLLKNVRGLTFVAAHLGGCSGFPAHATDALLECGAYIDTSSLRFNWHRDEETRLLASWPADRLLFATDFPWEHYPEALAWVRSVRPAADLDAIFGANACRLLGLNRE